MSARLLPLLGLLLVGCPPADDDPIDTDDVVTDTDGDTDSDTEAPPPPRPDRAGVTAGGDTLLDDGSYRMRVSVGDPLTVHERFDGDYVLRLGVGTTQDSRPRAR